MSLRTVYKKKQRDNIEPLEIQAHLHQFLAIENLNFHDANLKEVLDASLSLITRCDVKFKKIVNSNIKYCQCEETKTNNKSTSRMLEIEKENCISSDLTEIIGNKFKSHTKDCSCFNLFEFSTDLKLLLIVFQQPTEVNISYTYTLHSKHFKYKCHVQDISADNEYYNCHFFSNDSMVCQTNGLITKSPQTYSTNIKLILLVADSALEHYEYDKYLYGTNAATKFFLRKSQNNLETTEQKEQKKAKKKEAQSKYFGSEKGKEAQSKYFGSEKGKEAKSKYSGSEKGKETQSKYFGSEKGKEALTEAKSKYSGSEKGKEAKAKANKNWRKNKMLNNFDKDTSFDIICCYCNIWKSRYQCVTLNKSKLTEEELEEYIHLDDGFNRSKDQNYYICKICRDKIKSGKVPKINDKEYIQLADFPQDFLEEVKKVAKTKEVLSANMKTLGLQDFDKLKRRYEKEVLKLNKLESFILKLVLPFIRVAHCKRSPYLKVLGNLILISNDIQHSFNKLLPQPQQIQAVSFKRKLEYKGTFMEEWVDTAKVIKYFEFLKANNPLFKDYVLDEEKLQQFEQDTLEAAEQFETQDDGSNIEESTNLNTDNIPSHKEHKKVKKDSNIKEDDEDNIEQSTSSETSHIPRRKKDEKCKKRKWCEQFENSSKMDDTLGSNKEENYKKRKRSEPKESKADHIPSSNKEEKYKKRKRCEPKECEDDDISNPNKEEKYKKRKRCEPKELFEASYANKDDVDQHTDNNLAQSTSFKTDYISNVKKNKNSKESPKASKADEDEMNIPLNIHQRSNYYEIKSIPGDGHCLFNSIGNALPQKLNVEQIRGKIYKKALRNIKFFGGLVENQIGYGDTMDDFEQTMRRNQHYLKTGQIVWGNAIDFIIATHVFNVDIYVYNSLDTITRAYSARKGILSLTNFIVLHFNGHNHFEWIKMYGGKRPLVADFYSYAPHTTEPGKGKLYRYHITNGNPILLDRAAMRETARNDEAEIDRGSNEVKEGVYQEKVDIPVTKDILEDKIYISEEENDSDEEDPEKPFFRKEDMVKQENVSLFSDKYETDSAQHSIANRMADIVIDFEKYHNIIEDEIDLENTDDSSDLFDYFTQDEIFYSSDEEDEDNIEDSNIDKKDTNNIHETNDLKSPMKENSGNNQKPSHADIDPPQSPQRKKPITELLNKYLNPSGKENMNLSQTAKKKVQNIKDRMEKIVIAPGEKGIFQNWGEDIFLEEKCFPELFPYGYGGYLSSNIDNKHETKGFAKYIRERIKSADPKFRQDYIYIFFLLQVKELIQLKRCKFTYLRQAQKLPNLTKEDVISTKKIDLARYNRSFQVFKTMRGTSMYYEDAKKKLMAMLRQQGSPSLFMTVSCAEFKWKELVRQILETESNGHVTMEYVESLENSERNHIVSRSAIQSTCHFQKRVEKLFNLLQYENEIIFEGFKVKDFYYRIEFQARGAPHLHSLLWLEDIETGKAPQSFWNVNDVKKSKLPQDLQDFLTEAYTTEETDLTENTAEEKTNENDQKESQIDRDNSESIFVNTKTKEEELVDKRQEIATFASKVVFGSIDDAKCNQHRNIVSNENCFQKCPKCKTIRERVESYNTHGCTFTCHKKKRFVIIHTDEGHGRHDKTDKVSAEKMEIPKCRFDIPFFPLDETIFLEGRIRENIPEDEVLREKEELQHAASKKDLKQIRKFLLRQSYGHKEDSPSWINLKSLDFWRFLFEVGMFSINKNFDEFTESERENAKQRYLNALKTNIKGAGAVFLKRNVSDIFINNFNPNLMFLHGANHDIQIVVDQYAVAQYIVGYLTKNEAGMSKLLKNINDSAPNLSKMELLNKLASVLDRHREVSIQEATYRLMGFPMAKSSRKVKYVTTIHPHFRDGLLKENLENDDEEEEDEESKLGNKSIFHDSPTTYYEHRPDDNEADTDSEEIINNDEENNTDLDIDDEEINKKDIKKEKHYWDNLTFSEFMSEYDIDYAKKWRPGLIKLKGKNVFIKKRKFSAVLRYYLRYDDVEELCRGHLILFHPFRNEMKDIHEKDVQQLFKANQIQIEKIKSKYEAHKIMTDLIIDAQKKNEEKTSSADNESDLDKEDYDEENFTETTTNEEIKDFENWAKSQADKQLKSVKEFTNVQSISALRESIIGLNSQQRRIFDDVTEREYEKQYNSQAESYYLFLSGAAGTGKSFLMRVLMEATKFINVKAGRELNKPTILAMAPTANAAYILKDAKTIDSALCLSRDSNYVKLSGSRESTLKFLYEDVSTVFIDEISLVGSKKMSKINLRFQDIANSENKHEFMGGKSLFLTGDFFQLPPVKDKFIFCNNNMDAKPDCTPSIWDDHIKIYYLTEKVRSMTDPKFGEVCDRIATNSITEEDEVYLKGLVRKCPNDNDNELYKTGKLSQIVTTNKKREKINQDKLAELLPHHQEYLLKSKDISTNISNPPTLSEAMNYTVTGNLQKALKLKVNAPIMLTVNNPKSKYREDGLCNGARAYIDSFQFSEEDETEVKYIWVVFRDENIGKQLRLDNRNLLQAHKPVHEMATPIEVCKIKFNVKSGNVNYQRTQFPAVLAHAITAHRSQGDTLEEVIIDFQGEGKEKPFIVEGSFYVAITRAKQAEKVFLANFDKSYIKSSKVVVDKMKSMRKFHQYVFKKIFLSDKIFEDSNKELKIGYLNIQDLTADLHAEYVNSDKNLNYLDILVLAETWLTSQSDKEINEKLNNFHILHRYDANDSKKHCGLLILGSKQSIFNLNESTVEEYKTIKENQTHLQILTMTFPILRMTTSFIYIRKTPSQSDIKTILKYCSGSNILFGDLNLNPAIPAEKKLLNVLCGENKFLALEEITTDNFNQLDHIIADKSLKSKLFTTSYFNFISNHNSITARIGYNENNFTEDFLKKISCIKAGNISTTEDLATSKPFNTNTSKHKNSSLTSDAYSQSSYSKQNTFQYSETSNTLHSQRKTFKKRMPSKKSQEQVKLRRSCNELLHRTMYNEDLSSCWLNCCLQLILVAMDRSSFKFGADIFRDWESQLGDLLKIYKNQNLDKPLETSWVRQLLVDSDTTNQLNLQFGQQDSRDFFIALSLFKQKFSDVYCFLNYSISTSTRCLNCNDTQFQQNIDEELYREIKCPRNGSNLKDAMLSTFMLGVNLNDRKCQKCPSQKAINRSQIHDVSTAEYLTVILQRTIKIDGRDTIVENEVVSTDTVVLEDSKGIRATYEPIAVIQHQGSINTRGQSSGHYIADIKNQIHQQWFRTSDNEDPVIITPSQVSKTGYIILFARVSESS